MCIDRAPCGVKAPGERKVYPKIHFIAVPVSLVLKPTTRREIQKTVQTIVVFYSKARKYVDTLENTKHHPR